jgi:hypothetical protein
MEALAERPEHGSFMGVMPAFFFPPLQPHFVSWKSLKVLTSDLKEAQQL